MAKYIGNIPSVGEFKKLDSLTSTFNGSLTQFDLEYGSTSVSVGDASQLIVSLNGIIQEPLTAYTLAVGGSAIVFSSAPASTDTCHIILLGGVGGTSTVSDGAVTAAKLDAGLKDYLEETYTANGSQTTYTLTRAPIGTNDLMITIDGIVQPSTAYSIAGTTLTISPALPNGTDVRVVHMGVRAGFVVPSSSSITAAMFQDFTTDVKFNDNAKAVFGTGNDLQIYHDGSSSYISDVGTGNLRIKSNGVATQILDGSSLNLAVFNSGNGQAQLYNVNSGTSTIRLATTSSGIDVTGTVTSGGLTTDSISNSSGNLSVNTTQSFALTFDSNNDQTNREFNLMHDNGVKIITADENGDIKFYEDTGTTAKFFWDASAERLGIGATAPIEKLHVTGQLISTGSNSTSATAGAERAIMDLSAYSATDHSARLGHFRGTNTAGAGQLRLYTDSVERARIDASGNFLVGKTSTGSTVRGSELRDGTAGYIATLSTDAGGLSINRTSTAGYGDFINFRYNGQDTGRINTRASFLGIGCGDTGLEFHKNDNTIYPYEPSTSTLSNGNLNLGSGAYRFKDLYLSGGAYLGGTGSANKLDDYEEGTWTPTPTVGSVSSGSGNYTKVGRLVTVNAYMGHFSNTVNNEVLIVSGLPFTGGVGSTAAGSAMWSGVDKDFGYQVVYYDGSSQLRFYHTTNQNFDSIRHIDLDGSGTEVYFTATYMSA